MARALAVMLFALSVGACGAAAVPTPTPTRSPGPTAGWIVFNAQRTQTVAGVAKGLPTMRLSVPPDWVIASETSELYKYVKENYQADGDNLTVRFVAAGPNRNSQDDYTVAFVMSWVVDRDYTVEDVAGATFYNYARVLGALMVGARTVDLGTRAARRQEIRWELDGTSGHTTMWAMQYFIVRGHDVFWMELETALDRRAELIDTFDRVAESFSIPD